MVQAELGPLQRDTRLKLDLEALVAYCDARGIVLMSHSPLRGAMKDQRARALAARHGVGVPQLLLRYAYSASSLRLFTPPLHTISPRLSTGTGCSAAS